MKSFVNVTKATLISMFLLGLSGSGTALAATSEDITIKHNVRFDMVNTHQTMRASGEVQIRRLKNILYSEKINNGEALFDELIVLQKKVRERK